MRLTSSTTVMNYRKPPRDPYSSVLGYSTRGHGGGDYDTNTDTTTTTTRIKLEPERQQSNDSSTEFSGTNQDEGDDERLAEATRRILDTSLHPLGSLTHRDAALVNELMQTWSKHQRGSSAVMVERLLKRLVDELVTHTAANHNNKTTVPTTIKITVDDHYKCILEAWTRTGGVAAAERAASIHRGLVEQRGRGVGPTVETYNLLLRAWKHAASADDDPQQARVVQEAEGILREMEEESGIQPNSVMITTVLEIYSRQLRPRADDATKDKMVRRCEELVDRIVHHSNNSTDQQQEPQRPNNHNGYVYLYAALQTVYARSRLVDAVDRSERILQRMLLDSDDNPLAKPHVVNYNAVLNALSKQKPHRDHALRANNLLQRMELAAEQSGYPVEPDRVSYALAILTCARCKVDWNAALLAEEILERLEARAAAEHRQRERVSSVAGAGRVTPLQAETFNVVLTALSQCAGQQPRDAPERALRILQRMEGHYQSTGDAAVRPNVRSWNGTLCVCARMSLSLVSNCIVFFWNAAG